MTINFYSTNGDYGCFSNFSYHTLFFKSRYWKTSEHYFQAQKFAGTKYESMIAKCVRPSEAARMGRDRSLPLRKDWESIKDSIMREAVLCKFAQNADIKKVLLSTGDEKLVEHTENDKYWGDGGDGSGKNRLGKILMEVREVLRQQDEFISSKEYYDENSETPVYLYLNKMWKPR